MISLFLEVWTVATEAKPRSLGGEFSLGEDVFFNVPYGRILSAEMPTTTLGWLGGPTELRTGS
jgi:hypothetical protein